MRFETLIERLGALTHRMEDQAELIYCQFNCAPSVEEAQLDELQAVTGTPVPSPLSEVWSTSGGLNFQWSVTLAGCVAAGFDSREAPEGGAEIFSPAQVAMEWTFLQSLSPSIGQTHLPFGKNPLGEILVLRLDTGAVELLRLDAELNMRALADSITSLWAWGLGTYFERSAWSSALETSMASRVIMGAMANDPFHWPLGANTM